MVIQDSLPITSSSELWRFLFVLYAPHTRKCHSVFDDDKNGEINFKEFICALSITSRGKLEEKLHWAFQLYDIDGDGYITYDEMLQIVRSIYKMTGQMVKLPEDEDTPEKVSGRRSRLVFWLWIIFENSQRVDKIFKLMDHNKDQRLTYEEFQEGSKKDPTIVQVSDKNLGSHTLWSNFSVFSQALSLYDGWVYTT